MVFGAVKMENVICRLGRFCVFGIMFRALYMFVMGHVGNLRERDHWRDPDIDGRIILGWIFRKWEGVVGTGWSWLRIGTGGGHLWVR